MGVAPPGVPALAHTWNLPRRGVGWGGGLILVAAGRQGHFATHSVRRVFLEGALRGRSPRTREGRIGPTAQNCSGQWSVVSGQWSVVSGQWSVVSGQWSVVSCQLSVVSCQWSVVSCQRGCFPCPRVERGVALALWLPWRYALQGRYLADAASSERRANMAPSISSCRTWEMTCDQPWTK